VSTTGVKPDGQHEAAPDGQYAVYGQAEGVPVHTPAWHVCDDAQTSPALQLVPSALVGFEQVPVVGLQVPAT